MRLLLYPVTYLLGVSSYVIFGVVGAAIGYVMLPLLTTFERDPMQRVRRGQLILSRMCRFWIGYMTIGGLIRLRIGRLPVIETGRPSVVIANHPTLLDIIMLIAAVPHITFVVKASYYRSKLVGPLLRFGKHICAAEAGDDAAPVDGASVLREMLARLEEGYPIMVFPEGTRSPAGELRSFKRGAFEAAMRAGVPLHCLLIEARPPALLKGTPWWKIPTQRIRYHISSLRTDAPPHAELNTRAWRGRIRDAYAAALGIQESSLRGRAAESPAHETVRGDTSVARPPHENAAKP